MKTAQGIAAVAALVGSTAAQLPTIGVNGVNGVNGINGINTGNYPQGYPVCAQNCLNQFAQNQNFQQTCQSSASYLANCIQSAGCGTQDLNSEYRFLQS